MQSRAQLRRPGSEPPRYFPSGSTLLDQVNGGGWALNRVINLVGDKSTDKTGLAIEACANFAHMFGAENIRYNEPEFAFDPSYATNLGMPDGVTFVGEANTGHGGSPTVEHFINDLMTWLDNRKASTPCLYLLDSLDALTDEAELVEKEYAKGWNTRKARIISEFFRRNIQTLSEKRCTLFIVSQIRENIGVTFGEKYDRSGGKALDFYAYQIDWLAHLGRIEHETGGQKRVVGIKILANNKKNKLGPPFAKAEFQLYFNYGIDDELSMIAWLKAQKADSEGLSFALDRYGTAILRARDNKDREALSKYAGELRAATIARWKEIEENLKPPMQKYGA